MTEEEKHPTAIDAHFKHLQGLPEQIFKHMAPIRQAHESIQKSIQSSLDKQREAFEKTVKPIIASQELFNKIFEPIHFPTFVPPDLSPIAKQLINSQNPFQEALKPAFQQLQQGFKELPTRTQEALLLLGQHGWFLDPKMPVTGLWELKVALSEGNVSDAESALVDCFSGRLEEIEAEISIKFPHRAHIIHSAFDAHRAGEYALSIPVLFAQTDGICKDSVDQYLFLKDKKKSGTAIYVDKITSDTYLAALLSPLAVTLPISASANERKEGFASLNRHTVLHGESLDYDTEVNSFKAISLINYVVYILKTETS